MAVYRVDLDACIDFEKKKSIIAYVTECQICGQCIMVCPVRSLGLTFEEAGQPLTSYR